MKTHRFFSVFLLLILAVSLLTGPASAAEVPDPAIQAKAALLVDANTGRMVYGKNEHEELYPASLTKIMTALLTLEAVDSGQLSMDQPITVTESALEGLAPHPHLLCHRPHPGRGGADGGAAAGVYADRLRQRGVQHSGGAGQRQRGRLRGRHE